MLLLTAALTGCGGAAAGEADLPVGDPGREAPAVAEPAPDADGDHGHGHDAVLPTAVPDEAMLDAATVAGIAGGTWQVVPVPAAETGPCGAVPVDEAGASRSTRLVDSVGRVVTQTVQSYEHGHDAEAVSRLAGSFRGCGWEPTEAPALGEHSAQAHRADGVRTVVLAAEGVLVVLVGGGGIEQDTAAWDGLADVSLGSACAAAPDGCH
jgi:hypothetical protein